MNKNQVFIFILSVAGLGFILWTKENAVSLGVDVMTKLTRKQFIEKFAPLAKDASRGTGLFPSVFMAQAILESGDGNSSLSRQANNYFGIKADKSWVGDFVIKPTTEYVNGVAVKVDAKFRAYKSALQSFYDRVEFLQKNSRYKNAGVFIAATPEDQARALQKAGYATDPNYANLLITLINQNKLKNYD